MADVLNDEKLLHAVNNVFRGMELFCERIGPYCNAGRPRPFTKAECVVQPIVHWPIGGTKIGFQNLLGTGFDLISDLRQGKKKYEELNSHFKKPFQILDEFMKSKSEYSMLRILAVFSRYFFLYMTTSSYFWSTFKTSHDICGTSA